MFLNIKNIPWPQFSGLKIVAICGQLVLTECFLDFVNLLLCDIPMQIIQSPYLHNC